ncbi:MAG: DUF2069 domain-containing protein [Paraglaciecola sp.]|uniref:DUF2069 domain-containing protein n=1 Tax=Pseudomonadati TaxID=3379134 RepID=UPI00273E7734|nr:DUF2069 domain-containing protein [Paraglaciecola sp.]MDP5029152.1 DUF2069 domain-containing protein [Paraglaciecola sp.]MDP5040579.1 DUF2069 domain-containing protein [Paraglaciecola sp.]MDP5129395.1 DUF2069 domain-containing protein [Paraglaciecola sp.]
MKFDTLFYRRLTLSSYFLLLVWLVIWHFFLTPDKATSTLFTVILWIVPILLPIKGLVQGKPYTHAWTNFIVMYYLLHGLTAVYAVEGERLYALVEIVLCSALFTGCSFYARLRGRELGLGIRKLKEELAEEKQAFEQNRRG